MQEYFEIGQIVNTSGLKGLVKANLLQMILLKLKNLIK